MPDAPPHTFDPTAQLPLLKQLYFEVYDLDYRAGTADALYRDENTPLLMSPHDALENGFEKRLDYLLHPDDRSIYDHLFNPEAEKVLHGLDPSNRSRFVNVRFKKPDGTYRWVSAGLIYAGDPDNDRRYFAVSRDVTDDLILQEKTGGPRAHRLARLKNTINSMPLGVVIFDLGDEITLRCANTVAYCLLGLSEGEELRLTSKVRSAAESLLQCPLGDAELSESALNDVFAITRGDASSTWIRLGVRVSADSDGAVSCWCTLADENARIVHQKKLVKQRELYELALEGSGDILFEYNLADDIAHFSNGKNMRKAALGNIADFAKGTGADDFIHPEDRGLFFSSLRAFCNSEEAGQLDVRLNLTNAGFRWYRMRLRSIVNASGTVISIVAIFNEIDDYYLLQKTLREEREQQEKLREQATTDYVTGLLNRYAFREAFNDASIPAAWTPGAALFVFDVDNFKSINDTHGHMVGDKVLSEIGESLQHAFRKSDLVARLGGDEFIVFLPSVSRDVAAKSAQRIIDLVDEIKKSLGLSLSASVSIGIVYGSKHTTPLMDLYRKADAALYEAKAAGKRSYRFSA